VIATATMETERRRTKDAWALKTPENGSIMARERRTIQISLSKSAFYTNWVNQEPALHVSSLPDVSQWVSL
jgi:hypothetical protein